MDSQDREFESWKWSNNCLDLNDCLDIPVYDHGFLENRGDGSALQVVELRLTDSYSKFRASLN